MAKVMLEKIKDEIIGLEPVYTDTGNATQMYLRGGGAVIDPRRLQSVQSALGRMFAIDFPAQRSNVGVLLERGGTVPFYLAADRVYVPMKMRKARCDGDMVYGYFDVSCITVKPSPEKGAMLLLEDGRQLRTLSNLATAIQSRAMGLRLLELLRPDEPIDPRAKAWYEVANYLLHSCRDITIMKHLLEKKDDKVAEDEDKYG